MCAARLGDSSGLVCTRTDAHERGHVFVASSLNDKHDRDDSHQRQDDES